jgi:hypothetical protein
MIKAVKEIIFKVIKRQDGVALPAVLAMLVIGGFLIVPSINYVVTNLKAGSMAEEEFKAILAADCGVEDALWKIKNDTPSEFPHSYTIADVNGLSVDITIDQLDTIASEPVGNSGSHSDRLLVSENVTYDDGIYYYKLILTSNHNKPIKIDMILIDFPPNVDYVSGSTISNVTKPPDADPNTISGTPTTGITLVWINDEPQPAVSSHETENHTFELSGPPGIEGVEGHGFVEAHSDDIGTVWVSEVIPYSITAEAKDASEEVVATIRAGVWSGTDLDISCWQVIL